MMLGYLGIHMPKKKKLDADVTSSTKINFKWVIDLNINSKL